MNDSSRDRIVGTAAGSLGETIYAGAGAGTGKTQALVERIANLVTRGSVKPENIAAITFTGAAASELRQRVRQQLEERLETTRITAETDEFRALSSALSSLDSAFIGTIHSFAQSLLRERPLDVGLPPVFELVDEVQQESRFDEEWDRWLDDALADPEFEEAIQNAQRLGLGTPLATLRALAGEMHANYDLVARIGDLASPAQTIGLRPSLESIRSDLAVAIGLRDCCTDADDLMFKQLDSQVAPAVSWIDEALEFDNDDETIFVLTQLPKLVAGRGAKNNWNPLPNGDSSLEEVRSLLKAAQKATDSGRQALGEATVVPLVNAVGKMVLAYANTRRAEGLLEFQDLLVLSCELLSENDDARKYFQSRYTHVLIDEFQDTDPLQLKLAMLLTDRSGSGRPTNGALFVVGDGKQSIYRFRRADLTQLQALVDSLGAERLSLTSNFRSTPAILDWVNAVFEPWMNGPAGSDRDPLQAEYVPLEPARTDDGHTEIPRVMIAGGIADGNADVARESEAEDIARLAETIGAGGWSLSDRSDRIYRSSFRDLCVLMPRRTSLPALEEAFVRHGVPYVLEGQAPIFESQTFNVLSNSLAAIDDPTDQVAIVAALKSIAWGCSDQDLYEWARLGHKFEYARHRIDIKDFPEGTGARRVADALEGISNFHDHRQEQSTPYLVEQLIRSRRLREVAALMDSSGNGERLMDMLIEMSRTLQRSGTGSLREFVRWLSGQAKANVRAAEGALANSEVNAVRVMTIHAAKGLEFPIVALVGLQGQQPARRDNSIITEQNGKPVLAVQIGAKGLGLATFDYDAVDTADRQADAAELVRLAYVGATRAREHLVVSVHRTARAKNMLAGKISEFAEMNDQLWEPFAISSPAPDTHTRANESKSSATATVSMDDREQWLRETSDVVDSARKRGYVVPSQLAHHDMFVAQKPEDNADSTEWNTARRGRGGTDLGSAVHAVLQDVDFGDLSTLDELVRLSADAYSMPDEIKNITRLVRNVLESPVVAGATSQNSWREAWVAAEIADGLEVEGSIDLIIQNADGTVTIIDYKTDRVSGESLIQRAKGYEPQLAGYALIVEKLGLPGMANMKVKDAVLVFADGGPGGTAYEHRIDDLDAAKATAIDKIRESV